jgi:DNA-binding NarL/FixJ family response regulator
MQPMNVVIASDDPTAVELAAHLNRYFRSVAVAHSLEEARAAIPRHCAQLAVVDLETVPLERVRELCREFGHTSVVCTHRLPDEEIWISALAAGAIDCCHNADVAGILEAVERSLSSMRTNAA